MESIAHESRLAGQASEHGHLCVRRDTSAGYAANDGVNARVRRRFSHDIRQTSPRQAYELPNNGANVSS